MLGAPSGLGHWALQVKGIAAHSISPPAGAPFFCVRTASQFNPPFHHLGQVRGGQGHRKYISPDVLPNHLMEVLGSRCDLGLIFQPAARRLAARAAASPTTRPLYRY